MADAVPFKRVLPPRERRERPSKRRASSPVHAQPPTPTTRKQSTPVGSSEPRPKRKYNKRTGVVRIETPISRSSPSVSIAEEVLPTKVTANKPLPTLKQKQPDNLSIREYQSIAESAILSASLLRSRMQWLSEGIFTKYWVKPIKRKGVIEAPPNNPDVKSMQKLGNATLTIEPHTFEAIFYTVRDPSAQVPYQRHVNQHGGKNMIPPVAPHGAYSSPGANQRPPMNTSSKPGTISAVPPRLGSGPNPLPYDPNTPAGARPQVAPRPTTATSTTPGTPRPSQPHVVKNSTTDPVIQMLAARAASDARLKELMKVVATSRATPEQLKEFQAHIDEFNEIIRRQEAERAGKKLEVSRPPAAPAGPAQTDGSSEAKTESRPLTPKPMTTLETPVVKVATPVQASSAVPVSTTPNPPMPNTTQPAPISIHGAAPPPPGLVPTRPMAGYVGYPQPPRPEPVIRNIVMEITSTPSGNQQSNPDRWLFPENAVLEIRYGGLEMLVSFLVEKKGSDILSSMNMESDEELARMQTRFKPDQEYYQPVTMTVKAAHHRTIETIARAAKPLPVVQEYMKDVMNKKERGPSEYLVYRLPRESVMAETMESGFIDSGVELENGSSSEEDELKDVYGI